jgi:hypothetical protein
MQPATSLLATQEIGRQLAALLGPQIDGPFRLIRYVPGFNFNAQYGMSAFWNPKTFAIYDQLCADAADGTVTLTGASFSARFAAILGSVGYAQSSADSAAATAATKAFEALEAAVLDSFERNFGRISKRDIAASGCRPPTKTGFILYYVAKNFPGLPPAIPAAFADFAGHHAKWLAAGAQIEKSAAAMQVAEDRVTAAAANVTAPTAANGGLQTGVAAWIPAFRGLPDNNSILASLSDPTRAATLRFDLQTGANQMVNLSVGSTAVGAVPTGDLALRLAPTALMAGGAQDDLWSAATRVEMAVSYTGLTILRADPVEISADRKTGWFSRLILSDVVAKTGQDATGFRFIDSTFAVADLFGPGKSFARVATFVISREPTVTLTFHGTGVDTLAARFATDQQAEVDLGGLVGFGGAGAAYAVQAVTSGSGTVTVTLAPPPPVGTTPDIDQTAHVIGGVVEYPP